MFKFIYKKNFLFVLLFILFLFIFSSNTYANFFNGNPEIVDKLNSAFEKIESWMLKLATPAAAVAVAVGLFMKKFSFGDEERLRIAKKDSNVKEVEEKLMKFYPKKEWAKRHLQMVLFGRYYCKAIKPLCENCKLKEYCKEKRK